MPQLSRWVFWQNQRAFHQVPHITALAETSGIRVTWVVAELVDEERAAQGWSVPDIQGVDVVVAPDEIQMARLVQQDQDCSIHVFGGIHLDPLARTAFHSCSKTRARIALLNEPPIPGSGIRNLLVRPYHRAHKVLFGNRVSLILGIGQMAVDFYKSIGYPESIIFPYGYFPELSSPVKFNGPRNQPVQLIFVGQLIKRKGVDNLLSALQQLLDLNWTLKIMGSGPEKFALEQLANNLGLANRVDFSPPEPNAIAIQSIAATDILVLPSRHDGWGAVVNEALMCGVPVIASDHCGSADLLKDVSRGMRFEHDSVDDLTKKLRQQISRGPRTEELSETIQSWCSRITGRAAASYMRSAAEFTCACQADETMRPVAPWLA
jgi:glycosyltransferase involved in cell wall biosynthesis